MVQAIQLGKEIDAAFRVKCWRLGLNWKEAINSPLASLIVAKAEKPPRKRRIWHRRAAVRPVDEV